jgi:PTS system cellobiose-specific IIC component
MQNLLLALSKNRYISSIYSGYMYVYPFMILGYFFAMLLNLPLLERDSIFFNEYYFNIITKYRYFILQIYYISSGFFSLWLCFGIGYFLGKSYKLDAPKSGLISVFSMLLFFSFVKFYVKDGFVNTIYFINYEFLSPKNSLTAIFISFCSVGFYNFFYNKGLFIKLPDSIPKSVAKNMEIVFPIFFMAIFMLILNVYFVKIFNISMADFFANIILLEIAKYFNNIFVIIFVIFLVNFIWYHGVNGYNIVFPVVNILTFVNLSLNVENFIYNKNYANVFVPGFLETFVFLGGVGSTIGLSFLMIFSKNSEIKRHGEMSLIPSLFNINEPVMFGVPIVKNKIFLIPFFLMPIINACVAFYLIKMGYISYPIAFLPFWIPSIIAVFFVTLDVNSMVFVLSMAVISALMYYPFFFIYTRRLKNNEKNKN